MAAISFKKKTVKRLTPAQAKAAAKMMASKTKKPMVKMAPMAKAGTKFTPPGYDAEDLADGGADEDKEKS